MSETLNVQSFTISGRNEVFLTSGSFVLNTGEIMALAGENVLLKRLFFKILASQRKDIISLVEDDTVLEDITLSPSERYILRTSILFGTFTAAEYLEYRLSHLDLTRANRIKLVNEKLSRLGLTQIADKKLKNLTAAEAFAVNATAYSVTDKKILLLECDAFLPTEENARIIDSILNGLKIMGYGVIISVGSNMLSQLSAVDRIGVIENGTIKETTKPKILEAKTIIKNKYLGKLRFLQLLKRKKQKAAANKQP